MEAMKQAVHCRWMIRRDVEECVAIDRLCSLSQWSYEDFVAILRKRTIIGVVAESHELLRGFSIYELFKNRIVILRLAVDPSWQRMAVGMQLVERLKSKLAVNRRAKLDVFVRETNMPGLLFFQSQGFTALGLERGWFEDTGEDAILMQYRVTAC